MSIKYHVIDGECRVRAGKIAGQKTLPCVIFDHWPSPQELLEIRIGIDINRSSHKPMERAKSLLDYIDLTGLTLMEACKKAGISQPFGSKLISLHKLAPDLQRKANDGWDLESAYLVSQEPNHDRQRELAAQSGLTRDQLRQKVRSGGQPVDLMVSVQGRKMNLSGAIEAMLDVVKELKKGQADHWDITTAMRVLRHRAQQSTK
jgi:ParB-like chromosome segregation protein Spo0J